MKNELKADIKEALKKSIRSFFKNKDVKRFHILDHIFPVERRIRSLIGGLETSLGTTVWEPVAKVLARHNNFIIINEPLLMPNPFPQILQNEIAELKRLRESKSEWISMDECVVRLRAVASSLKIRQLEYVKPPAGKGVDLYLTKNKQEYLFDIKTNQPNQRAGLDLNSQLLEWYAYRLCKDPLVEIEAKIAFPFNPYTKNNKTWWEMQGKRVYPLEEHKDALVENEFWDFCSGENNTWETIEELFIELGQENFGREFQDIFKPSI